MIFLVFLVLTNIQTPKVSACRFIAKYLILSCTYSDL